MLVKLTAPVKSLAALFTVMGAVPAEKVDAPPTVNAPVWVMAPVVVTARFPVTLIAGRAKAPATERVKEASGVVPPMAPPSVTVPEVEEMVSP